MHLGYIGLGKMGYNMVLRLREKGHAVLAFDADASVRKRIKAEGVKTADSLQAMFRGTTSKHIPQVVWLMVPAFAKAGKPHKSPVDEVISELLQHLKKGDTVIDGGNSYYEDSIRRGKLFAQKGIHFLDAGVSGGPGGARKGASLMIGGDKKIFKKYEWFFRDLAVPQGYGYMGKTGAGHFVKMVHNGIEYGMMQALAEGFVVLKKSPFKLDLQKIAEVYNHSSVIESRLVGWLKDAYEKYGDDLKSVSGTVGATGEGEWTVKTARKLGVPAPIIKGAFDFRVKSKKNPSYSGKILSVLRSQFGGHSVK